MKKFLVLALMAMGFSAPIFAQEEEEESLYPHMFVGLQGGVQDTFNPEFNNWKTFTPTGSISFGSFFNPIVGARLHVNGAWNKSGVDYCTNQADTHYNYNYLTTSGDVLVNLCNLFGKKNNYPVNLIFIGGLGFNYAWENMGRAEAEAANNYANFLYADNDNRWAFNGRLGLALDIPVAKHWSVNIEGDVNHIVSGKKEAFNTDNLQFVGQVGVAYKFGFKKKAAEPVYETRIDTIWYDETAYNPVVKDGAISWNVFYEIRESEFNDPDAQLAAIGAFLKNHRECKVSVKSYADVQTGNPTINMGYSQQRCEKAVKALTDAGVDPACITAEYFGDTVQPFAENDKNRVSIIKATGLKDVKEAYVVKKFRTEENTVRVK